MEFEETSFKQNLKSNYNDPISIVWGHEGDEISREDLYWPSASIKHF